MELALFDPSGLGDPQNYLSPEDAATANSMLSTMASISFEEMIQMMDSELTNTQGGDRAMSGDFNALMATLGTPSRGPSATMMFQAMSGAMSADLGQLAAQLERSGEGAAAEASQNRDGAQQNATVQAHADAQAAWGGFQTFYGQHGTQDAGQQMFQQQMYGQTQPYYQQEAIKPPPVEEAQPYQAFESPFAEEEHISDPSGDDNSYGGNQDPLAYQSTAGSYWHNPGQGMDQWGNSSDACDSGGPGFGNGGFSPLPPVSTGHAPLMQGAVSSGSLASIVYGMNPRDKFAGSGQLPPLYHDRTLQSHQKALAQGHPFAKNYSNPDQTTGPDMPSLDTLEQQVLAEIKQGVEPKHDILVKTLMEHSVDRVANNQGYTLYSQMLRNAKVRAPKGAGRGRASVKERMDGLEKQVADLQAQNAALTEETENMQCRMSILDRMIQLRREIADELLVHNVRLDEQLQATALAADTASAQDDPGIDVDWVGLPSTKTIPEIMKKLKVTGVFDEMSAFFVDIVEKFKMLLTEIDKLPMGTDMKGSPLQVALEKEVQGMQSYLLQKQTEGGYLVAHWQMEVHERAVKMNPTLPLDLQARYRTAYQQLKLTLEQKERIKLSYDIYTKRIAVMQQEKEAQVAALESLIATSSDISMHERTREILKANQALWRLRCINENFKEGHMMFNFIVMRKILDLNQLARLTVIAHPILPCVLMISELVAQDLKKTYGLDTTERTADEILKMCKNYNSKYMHLMSNS